jgi:hypothetical protein
MQRFHQHLQRAFSGPLRRIPGKLDETVIKKFSTFLALGQNIYGIRRREIGLTVIDPK